MEYDKNSKSNLCGVWIFFAETFLVNSSFFLVYEKDAFFLKIPNRTLPLFVCFLCVETKQKVRKVLIRDLIFFRQNFL